MKIAFKIETLQVQNELDSARHHRRLAHLVILAQFHIYGTLSGGDQLHDLLSVPREFMDDMSGPDQRISVNPSAILVVPVPEELPGLLLAAVEIFPNGTEVRVLRLGDFRYVGIAHPHPTREPDAFVRKTGRIYVDVIDELESIHIPVVKIICGNVVRHPADPGSAEIVGYDRRTGDMEHRPRIAQIYAAAEKPGAACVIGYVSAGNVDVAPGADAIVVSVVNPGAVRMDCAAGTLCIAACDGSARHDNRTVVTADRTALARAGLVVAVLDHRSGVDPQNRARLHVDRGVLGA